MDKEICNIYNLESISKNIKAEIHVTIEGYKACDKEKYLSEFAVMCRQCYMDLAKELNRSHE